MLDQIGVRKNLFMILSVKCLIPVNGVDNIEMFDKNHIEQNLFDFKYKVKIKNTDKIPPQLLEIITNEKLIKNSNKKIHNAYALKDRINNCIELIKNKSKNLGYFDVDISYSLKANLEENKEVNVVLKINLGKQYKLNKIEIACNEPYEQFGKDIIKEYKKFINKAFNIDSILEIGNVIKKELKITGYPYAEIDKKEIFLNRKDKTIIAKYTLNTNEKVYFGKTKISKDFEINDTFVTNRLLWKEGDLYNEKLIQMTSHLLSNSQIFSDILIELDKNNAYENKEHKLLVPININLRKEKPRSLEMNLCYSTTKKDGFFKKSQDGKKLRSFTGKIKWTHYNISGNGTRLSIGAAGNPHNFFKRNEDSDYELFSELDVPDIITPCDNILYTCLAKQEYTNAYYKKGQLISAVWTVPEILNNFKLQIGTTLERNAITNPFLLNDKIIKQTNNYQSISFPLYFSIDKRDSILNPKKGWHVYANIIPTIFFASDNKYSTLTCLSGTIYKSLMPRNKIILSTQSSLKYLIGGSLNSIPYDKRLYAGGQNSIRGYSNQMAGETLPNYKHPIGGKAVFELKNEIRLNMAKKIGFALFLETANISKISPFCSAKWYSSYGVGLRYNTIVGPIRFDIATPIKKRKKIDRSYQIYISLGQAF